MSERKKMLRVTGLDLETGDTETAEMPAGEYFILCTSPCYVGHTQIWASGKTVQLTIKDRQP